LCVGEWPKHLRFNPFKIWAVTQQNVEKVKEFEYFLRALYQWRLVGGAIGGWSNCNGWNGINSTVSNTSNIWKPHLWLCSVIPFQPLQWAYPPIAPPTSLHCNLCIIIPHTDDWHCFGITPPYRKTHSMTECHRLAVIKVSHNDILRQMTPVKPY
jgi:hypothetical protein